MDFMNKQLETISPIVKQLVGFPLAVGNIEVNPQDIKYDFSGWFYFTIILLCFLLVMGVFACLRGKFGKKKFLKTLSISNK